jgi:hypothetical protein
MGVQNNSPSATRQLLDLGLAAGTLEKGPTHTVGEHQQPVVLGDDPEQSPEGNLRADQEQTEPEIAVQLQYLLRRPAFQAPDDRGGAGSDDAPHEIFVEGLAGGHGHLVGGDPGLHRFVDGEPAHPPGRVAGERAVRFQLF